MKKIIVFLSVILFSSFLVISGFAESGNKKELVLMIGSSQSIFNSQLLLIDADYPEISPEIVDGRAYVPKELLESKFNISINLAQVRYINYASRALVSVRDVSEAYGLKLYFNDGVIILTNETNSLNPDSEKIQSYKKQLLELPRFKNKEDFLKITGMDKNFRKGYGFPYDLNGEGEIEDSAPIYEESSKALSNEAPAASRESSLSDTAVSGKADYSETNIQVKGVDEGDIIKTDGNYIFYAGWDKISIVKADPMEIMSVIAYDADDNVAEMFLHNNQLIVITNAKRMAEWTEGIENTAKASQAYYDYSMIYEKDTVKTQVYNISDIKNPFIEKEFEIDGYYVTSRKVNNELYIISNSYLSYRNEEIKFPEIEDTALEKRLTPNYSDILYFPEALNYKITNVTGIKLNSLKEPASVHSFLGGSGNIYMSQENLYIATTSYNQYKPAVYTGTIDTFSVSALYNTNIYKFALNNGTIKFDAKGRVPGTVLNQFAMDEHNGYFRIATTENGNASNMFVLNKTLNKSGEIRGIAPEERIYSVRFMGDKAYMVTFRVTDPLYAIDLKNPQKPVILGELKIPGYSNYLHPYDENHLIGIGMDTVEEGGSAFDRGMKISMFDVSDINNPKEKFTALIGDRGTSSEALTNHKAFLFDKEKNIMAFPVSVYIDETQGKKDVFSYGKFKFQGAYVYSVDIEKGFNLREKITHVNNNLYDNSAYIKRIIYIGEYLYTASDLMIKSNHLNNMTPYESIQLK